MEHKPCSICGLRMGFWMGVHWCPDCDLQGDYYCLGKRVYGELAWSFYKHRLNMKRLKEKGA